MKETSFKRISIGISIFLIICIIGIYNISDNLIYRMLLPWSPDGIIKDSTLSAVRFFLIKSISIVLLGYLACAIIYVTDKNKLSSTVKSICEKINFHFSKINYGYLKILILVLIVTVFLGISFYTIYNLDVGSDEGATSSCIKEFYDYGKFERPYLLDKPSLGLELIFYPYFILKHILPFSIYPARLITLFYSLILLLAVGRIVTVKYGINACIITIILLISDVGFVFLSSSAYGEIGAFLFLFLAIYLRTRNDLGKKETFLSALFFAIAGLNKLQLLPYIFIINLLFLLFQKTKTRSNFLILIYFVLFWFAGIFGFDFLQGYNLKSIAESLWELSHASSQMIHPLPLLRRLAQLSHFSRISNLLLVCVIVSYYVVNFKKVNTFEKALFGFSMINTFSWLFGFGAISTRTLLYAIIINYILISIITIRILDFSKNNRVRYSVIVGVVILFLSVNFVNGTLTSVRLANIGISDEINFANAGYATFSRKEIDRLQQKEFFDFINLKMDSQSKIYGIGGGYFWKTYTDKVVNSVPYNIADFSFIEDGSYLVLTYIGYKNDYVWDDLLIYLNNNAELVFKKNFYEIYKIIK